MRKVAALLPLDAEEQESRNRPLDVTLVLDQRILGDCPVRVRFSVQTVELESGAVRGFNFINAVTLDVTLILGLASLGLSAREVVVMLCSI